jgi:alkanesulfonate monooxygenase SsuD/methylene tetrahydromethanopterin reductase-like flavin-dependent oxidoreductase (luciferase family)
MAATIDGIPSGRFGINIVSGWNKPEYEQMEGGADERHRVMGTVSGRASYREREVSA